MIQCTGTTTFIYSVDYCSFQVYLYGATLKL